MEGLTVFGPKHISCVPLHSLNNLFPVIKFPCCFQVTSLSSARLAKFKAFTLAFDDHCVSNRTFKKLPPSEWGDHFISIPVDASEMYVVERKIDVLKQNVRKSLMFSECIGADKKKVLLIHLLISLGLAYHFEDEIMENLERSFENIEEMLAGEDSLYTVSNIFWVFRTYGYNISSDVFERYKASNENFKESLLGDFKGILSLFEAAQLGTGSPRDDIMDEALSFTTTHLESLASSEKSSYILKRIQNALYMPQHYNTEMLFAREYISFYEQEEDHDKMLLEFGKLNFKFLQMNWIQELKIVSKWWKDQDLTSKLPSYFRDRIVEAYFGALVMYFEPRFSSGRILTAKSIKFFTVVDDTCDRYGSVGEIESLVGSMERWVPDSADSLQGYLKTVFKFIWDIFQEFEREVKSKGRSDSVQKTFGEFKIFLRANLSYAKWAQTKNMPTFDEFLEVGSIEIGIYMTLACSFLGLDPSVQEEAFEWLKSRPKIIQAIAVKVRLMNDMAGFEDDMNRGSVANAVNFYMKQYGVTEEETFTEFHKLIRVLERSVNEEYLKSSKRVPRDILRLAINFGKMGDVTYRCGEGYTDLVGTFKDYITSLFVDLMLV